MRPHCGTYRTDMEHWPSVACELPPGVSSVHSYECVSVCVLPPIWSGATMSHLCMSAFFVPVDVTHHNVCSSHETNMDLDSKMQQ